MKVIFIKLINMSVAAGWLILAVILLRTLLRKAPKWLICVFWGIVAIKLACPFSIESKWSLIPSFGMFPTNDIENSQHMQPKMFTEDQIANASTDYHDPGEMNDSENVASQVYVVSRDFENHESYNSTDEGNDIRNENDWKDGNATKIGIQQPDHSEMNMQPDVFYQSDPHLIQSAENGNQGKESYDTDSRHPDINNIMNIFAYIWMAGAVILYLWTLISYIRLKKKVNASIKIANKIAICDDIQYPFILGMIRPMVYLPSSFDEGTRNYVLSHEMAHLKRYDYLWKPIGYFLLVIHWFNPLCWIAYTMFCKDIEMACDESVIKNMDKDSIIGYSQTLLDLSNGGRRFVAGSVAFGEVGVKDRVKGILNYKKPTFWIILAGVVGCIVLSICFLTNPQKAMPIEQDEVLQENVLQEGASGEENDAVIAAAIATEQQDPQSQISQEEEPLGTAVSETKQETQEKADEINPLPVSHEEMLKKRVQEEMSRYYEEEICYWDYADYDGDGNKEAFALVKINPKKENDRAFTELRFVDFEGTVTTSINYHIDPTNEDECRVITTSDEKRFFFVDMLMGEQGVTRVYGVRNGKLYEMSVSAIDKLHGLYQEDGMIWTFSEMDSEFKVKGSKIVLKYENGEFGAQEFEPELSLRKKLGFSLDEAKNEIVDEWYYDDYDGNGTKEAFAVISEQPYAGGGERMDYIDDKGNVTEVAELGGCLQHTEFFTAPDGKRFFQYATGTGAENEYRILGVKDGKPYELQISGCECKYHPGINEKDGKFYITTGSYYEEPEVKHTYTLAYENGEFISPDEYYFNYIGTVLYQYVGRNENIVIPRKCQDGTVFTEITKEPFSIYAYGSYGFSGARAWYSDTINFKSVEIPETITKIADGTVGFDQEGKKYEDFTIRCKSGSEAERYAKANDFKIEYID